MHVQEGGALLGPRSARRGATRGVPPAGTSPRPGTVCPVRRELGGSSRALQKGGTVGMASLAPLGTSSWHRHIIHPPGAGGAQTPACATVGSSVPPRLV